MTRPLAEELADLADQAERVAARAEAVQERRQAEGRQLGQAARVRLAAVHGAIGRILHAGRDDRAAELLAEVDRVLGYSGDVREGPPARAAGIEAQPPPPPANGSQARPSREGPSVP